MPLSFSLKSPYDRNGVEYRYCALLQVTEGLMRDRSRAKQRKVRGQHTNTPFDEGLADVVRETTRLWRKHHLGYDQTKYVVEQVRRGLMLRPSGTRRRTINRLDKIEVERLIQHTYQSHSKYELMI